MNKHFCECGNEHEIYEDPVCEKCGGEVVEKLIGDDLYNRCTDCGSIMPY